MKKSEFIAYVKETPENLNMAILLQMVDDAVENGWDEEMTEDYFSWSIKDFLNTAGQYRIVFENHYMLPYYREQWYKHELYPVEANTHAQFILRRWG